MYTSELSLWSSHLEAFRKNYNCLGSNNKIMTDWNCWLDNRWSTFCRKIQKKQYFPTPFLVFRALAKLMTDNIWSTVNWKILENRNTPVPGYSLVLLLLDCRVILGPGKGAGGARGCAPVGQHQGSVGRLEHLAHVPAHGRDVTVVRPRFFRVRLVLSTAALESML